MPIIVKDYTWEETESQLFISIPLKGVKAQKVDIFSTEEYVKVSFPPYLFECFMKAPVYDDESAVQVGNGVVIFKLQKLTPQIWGQLQHADKDDKEKARERRIAAVERHQERIKEKEKIKEEKQRERQSHAVKEQMRIEQEARQRIEDEKEAEKRKAMEELEKWKEQQRKEAEEEKARLLKEQQEKEELAEREREEIEAARTKAMNLNNQMIQKRKRNKKKDIFEEAAQGQTPRESGVIKVNFSHREFPTAARESTAHDEDEWLRKQAESRRIRELEDSDLKEEEKNPVWLRDKGNEFFKAGNYQAAVNVYSHAIRMDYKMPSLYSNRAACHLKLRNCFKAIEDCQKALELLSPPVQQNAAQRVRAHIRRGTAFCELEMYAEGLMDYEAALKIDPKNEQLSKDADRIRAEVEGEKPNVYDFCNGSIVKT